MAEKIKKYFAKKKMEAKFKIAGPGHKLTEDTSIVGPSKKPTKGAYQPPSANRAVTDATQHAAIAAMARINQQAKNPAFNTSLAAIQAQVKRELEAERKGGEEASSASSRGPITTELEASPLLAARGVYFKCPLISEEILSREEWKGQIKQFLLEQLEEERGITACLMIQSCNYNRSKVSDCIDILCKYLENIMAHPDETKFHKIRCSNASFRDKVLPLFGAVELLESAGFRKQILKHNDADEEFYVFNVENIPDIGTLEFLRDALRSDDRIELELDRNLQVLSPSQAAQRCELPTEFYALSAEDIRREQQRKADAAEKQLELRTKAMREKDELREIRKYKFAIMRIRFPDGLFLQGTFSVYEKFAEVLDFVQENIEDECPDFILSSPTGHRLEDSDRESTLFDLRLVPATILSFQWRDEAMNQIGFLKPEVMVLIQSL